MNENKDAPAVVRRRRKIVRPVRDKTPEPSISLTPGNGIKIKCSDEESSSTADTYSTGATSPSASTSSRIRPKIDKNSTAYRMKILNRRDKAVGTAVVRSQSTPRHEPEPVKTGTSDVLTFIRRVKRSLSSPRNREESSESGRSRSPHHFQRENEVPVRDIPKPTDPPKPQSPKEPTEGRQLTKLEMNLRRFEEERRKFEYEKRKFEKDKREMESVRYKRLEEFERKRSFRIAEERRLMEDRLKLERERALRIASEIPKPVVSSKRSTVVNGNEKAGSTSSMPTEEISSSRRSPEIFDDYESSTALSSSSREGDFDGAFEGDDDIPTIEINEPDSRPMEIEEFPIESTDISFGLKARKQKSLSRSPDRSRIHSKPMSLVGSESSEKKSWFRKLFGSKQPKKDDESPLIKKRVIEKLPIGTKSFFAESRIVWRQLIADHPVECVEYRHIRNRCISDLILLSVYCGMGGMLFRFVEGSFESFYKCGVRRVKRDFVDHLWLSSHNLREDDWKSVARTKLRQFEEELHTAHEAGMTTYSGMKAWSFINGIIYCMTVVTTIGYGHISPKTNTGKAITIVYAIIGIPMFLILLADFGKLFTRMIKFVWAYVRRLYYTGSCRRVRKQAQVQEILHGMNMAYEIATFRRPSMIMKEAPDLEQPETPQSTSTHLGPPLSDSPTTPMPDEIKIDDEFNLPISLAFFILLAYIFCGASVYTIWEKWSFFESCYFVFISMSTIGFGDYVPQHPMYMMASIIYLVFGLALTSMCINVVQLKLSDSFRQASAKIGATIGLTLAAEEEANASQISPEPDDIPSVHSGSIKPDGTDSKSLSVNRNFETPPPLLPRKPVEIVINHDEKNDKKKKSKK